MPKVPRKAKMMDEDTEQYWKGDLQRARGGTEVLLNALKDVVKVLAQPMEPGAPPGSIALVQSDFICVFIDGVMGMVRGLRCHLDKVEGRLDELLSEESIGEVGRERAERLREAAMKALEAAEEDGCASTPGNRRMAATLRKGLGFPLLEWQEEEDVLQ